MGVIEEIRAGNKEAIKEVYKENVKDVYNFAKSITGDHDTALDATKKTFVILFKNIQNGEEPTNIRLAALKIAYDEACAIVMPSTEAIDSPYDKQKGDEDMSFKVSGGDEEKKEEPVKEKEAEPLKSPERKEPEKTKEPAGRPAAAKEEKPQKSAAKKVETIHEETLFEDEYNADEGASVPEEPVKKKEKKSKKAQEEIEEEEEEKKKHPVASMILLIINIILIIILIWFILGLLQNLEIIPEGINMGHEWFNNTIYPLF